MSVESTEFREPRAAEMRLILALVAQSPALRLPQDWLERLRVQTMNDGGMGSLKLSLAPEEPSKRMMGGVSAELQFKDADGVDVLASLNVDRDGNLFELDIWKVDFSPLIRIPATFG